MTLRPYQASALAALEEGRVAGYTRQLLLMATGGGKTVVFIEYARRALAAGRSVLVVAHREDLVMQAVDKGRAIGLEPGIEMAGLESDPDDQLVVGSVASLWGDRRRLHRHFDLVIVDEAHHSMAPKWKRFLESLSAGEYLGVTATPFRMDRQKLSEWWDRIAYEVTLPELISQGFLCDILVQSLPVLVDLPKVSGELSPEQADALITPLLREIAGAVVKASVGRRSVVVFLPLIDTSKRFADLLRECGVSAGHVDGEMDRTAVMADFRAGRIQYLCNAAVLTEGWDEPCVDCVVPLRPIKSSSLYQQIVGRGTRLFSGKANMLLLDLLWQTKQHYARPASLFSDDPEMGYICASRVVDKPLNLEELAAGVAESLRIARELALIRKTKAEARRKAYTVTLADFCKRHHVAVEAVPSVDHNTLMATAKQVAMLRRFRVVIPPEGLSRAAASTLMSRMFAKGRR
jgi:superfamily II DNA or RNA helicase